jgi:hypothetical protein
MSHFFHRNDKRVAWSSIADYKQFVENAAAGEMLIFRALWDKLNVR